MKKRPETSLSYLARLFVCRQKPPVSSQLFACVRTRAASASPSALRRARYSPTNCGSGCNAIAEAIRPDAARSCSSPTYFITETPPRCAGRETCPNSPHSPRHTLSRRCVRAPLSPLLGLCVRAARSDIIYILQAAAAQLSGSTRLHKTLALQPAGRRCTSLNGSHYKARRGPTDREY